MQRKYKPKNAAIHPVLKKPTLDPQVLANYFIFFYIKTSFPFKGIGEGAFSSAFILFKE